MCHYQTRVPYHGVKSLTGGLNTYLPSDYIYACMRGCVAWVYTRMSSRSPKLYMYTSAGRGQLQAVHAPDIVQLCILTQCAHFHASHTRETSIYV